MLVAKPIKSVFVVIEPQDYMSAGVTGPFYKRSDAESYIEQAILDDDFNAEYFSIEELML